MGGFYNGFGGNQAPTGEEVAVLDLPQSNTALPESVGMSAQQISGSRFKLPKNLIVGGDFTTSPWQRGTSFTGIANTLAYTADRFFAVGGASSSISVSRQTDAPDARILNCIRVGRAAANADTAALVFGQAAETLDAVPYAGKTVVLSFWAKAGANFSPTGGLLGLTIAPGTGTDQSAATLVAGTWTGYAAATLSTVVPATLPIYSASGNNDTGLYAGNQATTVVGVGITTSWVRYQVVAAIPATATQIGVLFSMTPVGTAGANDWYQLAGIQLETVAVELPYASVFERQTPAFVRTQCQRHCYQLNEKATVAAVQANGMMSATNVQTVCIPLPVTMRTTPTVTVTAGNWRFNIAGTLTAVGGGFAAGAAATQSPEAINVVGAVTATVGQATQLVSGAATWGGSIVASADL